MERVFFDNIPQELKEKRQWVLWRSERRGGKFTKIPYTITGDMAKTNNPDTWYGFSEVREILNMDDSYSGIGFVLTKADNYVGIDLDDCIVDGEMVNSAKQIISTLGSYTEISPSGNGVKIVGIGELPDGFNNKYSMDSLGFKEMELYDQGRYFTITGHMYEDYSHMKDVDLNSLEINVEEEDAPARTLNITKTFKQRDHTYLLDKMRNDSEIGDLFIKLYDRGDVSNYKGDDSRADLSLLNLLARHCGFDSALLDELFRGSALYRPKWDEKRGNLTYGEMSIDRVLKDRPIFHEGEIKSYLNYFYEFKRNVVLGRTEILEESGWEIVDQVIFNTIYMDIIDKQIKGTIPENRLRIILNSRFIPEYDPFKHYFSNLPSGKTGYIKELTECVPTTDDEYWRKTFKKWLVATVACAVEDEVVNHTVLILKGGQGAGKTTFLLRLIPDSLKSYLYSGAMNPGDSDTMINISECMLINLDELEALTKYKESAIKEIITKSHIRNRRPYAPFHEKEIRRASFMGSVNSEEIFQDTTGSRRFLLHDVNGKINYNHTVDLDSVWAEAYDLYKSGFEYHFDLEEIQEINKRNEAYEITTTEEESLLEYFEPGNSDDPNSERLTTTQILKFITGQDNPSHVAKIRLGRSLSKHDFPSQIIRGKKEYHVKRVQERDTFGNTILNLKRHNRN